MLVVQEVHSSTTSGNMDHNQTQHVGKEDPRIQLMREVAKVMQKRSGKQFNEI